MKRLLAALLALVALVAVGCSSGAPKAAAPEVKFDYGDVPTTEAEPRNHEFVIKNEGTGDLKIADVQVKLLQGC
jgi:ABC-type glycerol-3-phosphate transport system substrate-binding protein